jgi:hypothetical protein
MSDPPESADIRVIGDPRVWRLYQRLERAAGLRARGESWDEIGRQLGCPPETCREWPTLYAPVWRELCAAASRAVLAPALAEALIVLREGRR